MGNDEATAALYLKWQNNQALITKKRLIKRKQGLKILENWSTACTDWAERIKEGISIIPTPIYPEQAEQALNIFKQLQIVNAPNSPTFGESCAQWYLI